MRRSERGRNRSRYTASQRLPGRCQNLEDVPVIEAFLPLIRQAGVAGSPGRVLNHNSMPMVMLMFEHAGDASLKRCQTIPRLGCRGFPDCRALVAVSTNEVVRDGGLLIACTSFISAQSRLSIAVIHSNLASDETNGRWTMDGGPWSLGHAIAQLTWRGTGGRERS